MAIFTEEENEAIMDALQEVVEEQEHYLHFGGWQADYGKEWPEVAARKADRFRRLSRVASKANNDQLAWKCANLANMFEDSVD